MHTSQPIEKPKGKGRDEFDRRVYMSTPNYKVLETLPNGKSIVMVNGERMESTNAGKMLLGQPVEKRKNGKFTI